MYTPILALLPFLGIALASPVARQGGDPIRIVSNRSGQCVTVIPGHRNPDIGLTDCGSATKWTAPKDQETFILTYQPPEHGSGSGVQPIDAGYNPGNNGKLFLQQDGDTESPGLKWYWTNDNRIALFEGDQCWDEGDEGLQTYQCTPNNDNQVFTSISAA